MTLDEVGQLKPGDLVKWRDPHYNVCSKPIRVKEIRVLHDTVAVYGEDGSYVEARPEELERTTMRFKNKYRCECGTAWEDEWSCMCDDRCPSCDTPISPEYSEAVGDVCDMVYSLFAHGLEDEEIVECIKDMPNVLLELVRHIRMLSSSKVQYSDVLAEALSVIDHTILHFMDNAARLKTFNGQEQEARCRELACLIVREAMDVLLGSKPDVQGYQEEARDGQA